MQSQVLAILAKATIVAIVVLGVLPAWATISLRSLRASWRRRAWVCCGLFTEPPQQPRLTPAEYQVALDACLASATTLANTTPAQMPADRRAFGP